MAIPVPGAPAEKQVPDGFVAPPSAHDPPSPNGRSRGIRTRDLVPEAQRTIFGDVNRGEQAYRRFRRRSEFHVGRCDPQRLPAELQGNAWTDLRISARTEGGRSSGSGTSALPSAGQWQDPLALNPGAAIGHRDTITSSYQVEAGSVTSSFDLLVM